MKQTIIYSKTILLCFELFTASSYNTSTVPFLSNYSNSIHKAKTSKGSIRQQKNLTFSIGQGNCGRKKVTYKTVSTPFQRSGQQFCAMCCQTTRRLGTRYHVKSIVKITVLLILLKKRYFNLSFSFPKTTQTNKTTKQKEKKKTKNENPKALELPWTQS